MLFRAIVITALFTLIAFAAAVMTLGRGGLLFLAILGPAAVWLLPAVVIVVLPAGAFGGVMLTYADRAGGYDPDEEFNREAIRLAVLAMLMSALIVGWLVPITNQSTEAAFSRFQTGAPAALESTPAKLTLDALLAGMNSVPGARQELVRRSTWVVLSLLLPLLAAGLGVMKRRWTYRQSLAATLAVFVIFVSVLTRSS
jgi:hypothetical protein